MKQQPFLNQARNNELFKRQLFASTLLKFSFFILPCKIELPKKIEKFVVMIFSTLISLIKQLIN
jgi:hypothetical protein